MHSDLNTIHAASHGVLYLGADRGLPQRIRPLLEHQGISLATTSGTGDSPTPKVDPACRVLLLDTALLCPNQTIKEFVETVGEPGGRAPDLVVIAHSREIELRLQALRADAAAYFVAPVASNELAERVIALCRPRQGDASRVLVVDHDATQALSTERVLTAAGFEVQSLGDPLKALEVIESFQPDLILTELHMPVVNGAELAALIREQDAFRLVPILFLSAERDLERQAAALSIGGDAFIPKPVNPDLLVRTLTQRIAAMRDTRRHFGAADHLDPDTGLATRRHFMSRLGRAIAEPASAVPGQGLLVVALDGAGRLNEQFGTGAADLVVDRIGGLIGERLGQADLAVRLDDHRHALLLRRPGTDALRDFAEDVRTAVSAAPFQVAGNSVTVGVSIGIGLLRPAARDTVALISRAERACAQAAASGGNRTVINLPTAAEPLDAAQEQHQTDLIERALGGSDKASGFRILYQPMVAVKQNGLRYVEVMLRLAPGDGALIPAADFLPAAERAGRVAEIDRWVMLRALAVLMRHCHAQPGLRLFVHQHVGSLIREGWLPWLRAQMLAHGLAQRRPILELYLHDLLKHRHLAGNLITLLRKIGVQVCLVGVDHTPVALELVKDLAPPFVKLSADAARQLKPARFADLVQRLTRHRAEVIACGIDTAALVGPVWASGVGYAQGAVIQAPQPEPVFDWGEVVAGQGV